MTTTGAGTAITAVIVAEPRAAASEPATTIATALANRFGVDVGRATLDAWSRDDVLEATARPPGQLVVLGANGRDAQEAIRASLHVLRCPTLIVPPAASFLREPLRLLCGVANDGAAVAVARFAARLCRDVAGTLTLLHVPSPRYDREAAQRLLAHCAPTLSTTVKATLEIRPGREVATLRAAARSERASVLVVGRPRHPQHVGTMLGSVPHALLRHGDLPLLVVPPPPTTGPQPWTSTSTG